MYFYLRKGKQYLDLTGNFILTHNDSLVKARIASAAPKGIKNGQYVQNIPKLNIWEKLAVTFGAINFIWGKSKALTPKLIKDTEEGSGTKSNRIHRI